MGEQMLLIAELLIYISLLIFTIYTIIFGYHWFNYGTSRTTSLIAMIVFLTGAAGLILILIGTYQFL